MPGRWNQRRAALLGTLLLAAAALLAGLRSAAKEDFGPVRERDFTITLRSRLLEPGRPPSEADPGAVRLDPLRWSGPASAETTVWLWNARSSVRARTKPGRRELEDFTVLPYMQDPRPDSWNLWRHRHAYQLDDRGRYAWTTLGAEPEPLPAEEGLFYDAYLRAVWELWTRRALASALRGEPPPPPSEPRAESDVPLRLRFHGDGLVAPARGGFRVHVWHIPVEVSFSIVPSSCDRAYDWCLGLEGPLGVSFDRESWRRRHGYRKTEDGYAWDADLGLAAGYGDADGRRLDRLMERSTRYWAEAALYQGLQRVDRDLRAAMAGG